MKDFSKTNKARIEALAKATNFDKLDWFEAPNAAHKNYVVHDTRTGLSHYLLPANGKIEIGTMDTKDYKVLNLDENTLSSDSHVTTKSKGNFGYTQFTLNNIEIEGKFYKHKKFSVSRLVGLNMGLDATKDFDHRNGNTYDDRRINKAAKTRSENCKNHYPYEEVPPIYYPWDELPVDFVK